MAAKDWNTFTALLEKTNLSRSKDWQRNVRMANLAIGLKGPNTLAQGNASENGQQPKL